MKILYLVLGAPAEGVRKKIRDKASFLRKAEGDISVVIVQGEKDPFDPEDGNHLVRVDLSSSYFANLWFFWRLSIILEQRKIYRALYKYLQGKEFDVILMRYPVADYFLLAFMKRLGRKHKIVFEHNTLEMEELKLRSAESFWYKYFFWNEKWFGKKVRLQSSGMIGVTREICQRQEAIVNKSVPTLRISNGIDVTRIKGRQNRIPEKQLNLLFLAGSVAPWHGVDILLNSLKTYHGAVQVHCYIAGEIDKGLEKEAQKMSNVTVLKNQSNADLDDLVDKCHIGIGSLALFRNNMIEACTLKVREYWARGLPFVIGYDDTDLIGNLRMQPFYRKLNIIGKEASPAFDLVSVILFASEVFTIKDFSDTMRSLAHEYIGYPAKAKAYLNFFKSLSR
jgi:hypothetical protein